MSDYRDFLGDSYSEKSGEFDQQKAKNKALNEKEKCNIIICGASGVGKSTLRKLCKTSPLVWQASACHGILFAHEAIEP